MELLEEITTSLKTADTAELVLSAQSGDREAFGELVERYQRSVFGLALRRLGNYAEAQELTQEVFVQALRKIDQLREPEAFGGWLRSIATRMAINRSVRRAPVTSAEPEALEGSCADLDTPLDHVLARERQTQVRAGLRRLGALDRQTLVAFYVNGRTLIEMSDEFDSPVGTIKRRLHVARKRLAEALGEELVAV
jgi:RNA polymerase sigma-70 factor (ECF subfamily)